MKLFLTNEVKNIIKNKVTFLLRCKEKSLNKFPPRTEIFYLHRTRNHHKNTSIPRFQGMSRLDFNSRIIEWHDEWVDLLPKRKEKEKEKIIEKKSTTFASTAHIKVFNYVYLKKKKINEWTLWVKPPHINWTAKQLKKKFCIVPKYKFTMIFQCIHVMQQFMQTIPKCLAIKNKMSPTLSFV